MHVRNAQLAGAVLVERVKLARGDLVALDRVRLCEERAHVREGAGKTGRQFYRFTEHEADIGTRSPIANPRPDGGLSRNLLLNPSKKFDASLILETLQWVFRRK